MKDTLNDGLEKKFVSGFKRWIVFSDVHGNAQALKQFLEIEQPTMNDLVIFCGDSVGYYYEEVKIIEMLRKIPNLIAVKGNHDSYYVTYHDKESRDALIQKYGASYMQCNHKVTSYINRLPLMTQKEIAGYRVCVVHGSIENPLEGRIYPDADLLETEFDFVFFGHTHYRLKKKAGRTLYLNPGSLGQPRDAHGFSYAVLHQKSEPIVEFKNIEVDINSLQNQCLEREGCATYARNVLERGRMLWKR